MATEQEAVDSMMLTFQTAWDTTGHAAIYQDMPPSTAALAASDDTNSDVVPWARVGVVHVGREQLTMGGQGNRRFEANGLFTAEIYTPRGDGLTLARSLHRIVQQAFEGESPPNGVWFRNVRTEEVAPSGPWSHANVIAEFQYTEKR